MQKVTLSLILTFAIQFVSAQQGGGMWLPNRLNENEMKQMGIKISARQIFDSEKPSIKDAVAQFGGGCTSEVISPQGLLLTNHHCGYSSIQSHSSVDNNLLTYGFWAKDFDSELPNKGLKATFVLDIQDVTNQILDGVTDSLTEEKRNQIIKTNIEKTAVSLPKESWQTVKIEPFYNGNQYYAFITETFEDVRLVGAPPSSVGKFGSDTDNWVWPRHTGDFSIFRIYADKNNRPAQYSKDNIPYQPKYFLPVSVKPKKLGDFSFVYGFPGTTDEYLSASALGQIIDVIDPARISLRDASLKILDRKMRENKEIKIKYAAKYASIANGWKKWIGELQGLKQTNALQKKQAYEAEFTQFLNSHPKEKDKYGNLLASLNEVYRNSHRYVKANTYFNEVFYTNSETFRMAVFLLNLLNNKTQDFDKAKESVKGRILSIYKNYDADLDGEVSAKMLSMYSLNVEPMFQAAGHENYEKEETAQLFLSDLWKNSLLTGKKGNLIDSLSSKSREQLTEILQKDPVFSFVKPYYEVHANKITPNYYVSQDKTDSLQRIYMKAQLKAFPNKKFFPDANSTLRVTYGKIDGYSPRDAVYYKPFSTLKGVMEKYVPNDYEFDVSQKLIDLYSTKNYGIYAQDGEMPVNYLATNHTTGGNSGSPAFDAYGNLTGLNFDRVWEGTMSDLNYDPSICRNIMVDIRYVLLIIDKYAESDRLISELKIVK
ncbi:MAG: S46 family peptidase [Flavobacteriaceae bacterium]|jgi:hypothetical protein|nr:S46 family peptidase [Flavobacteriaceae bacterium]